MEPGPAHRRRRPAVACTECRRRKIRCDRGTPCGPCRKSLPRLRCVYLNKSVIDADPPPSHIHRRRLEAENGTHNLDSSIFDFPTLDANDFTSFDQFDFHPRFSGYLDVKSPSVMLLNTPSEFVANRSAAGSRRILSGSPNERSRQTRLTERLPARTYFDSPKTASLEYAQLATHSSIGYGCDYWYDRLARVKKLRFLIRSIDGSRESIAGENREQKLISCPEEEDEDEEEEDDNTNTKELLLGELIKLERVFQLQDEREKRGMARLFPLPKDLNSIQHLIPPRLECNLLLNAYLETFESVLCILDTTAFLSDYDRFWARRSSSSVSITPAEEPFVCKLLVILALGSSTSLSSTPITGAEAEVVKQVPRQDKTNIWVQQVRLWLAQKTAVGARADLDIVQILCLLALARHVQVEPQSCSGASCRDGAARLSADHDLFRLGIEMGLHRDPRIRSTSLPAREAEMRRRLWVTMLELSLHQYLHTGLVPPLNPNFYDCQIPSSDVSRDHSLADLTSTQGSVPASTFLAILASTQRLRLEILHHLNSPGVAKSFEESHRLATELNKTCRAELDTLHSSGMARPTYFQTWFLNVLTRPFALALSVPLINQKESIFTSYYSRRTRMEISAILLSSTHDDLLPWIKPSTPRYNDQAETRSHRTAAIYPSLHTPAASSTDSIFNAGHSSSCTALRVNGQGYFSDMQRQVAATLFADFLDELHDDAFPNLDCASFWKLNAILENTLDVFRMRVRASASIHACHEFILLAAANAYVAPLIKRSAARNIHESIIKSALQALRFCSKTVCLQLEREKETNSGFGFVEAAQTLVAADEGGDVVIQTQMEDTVMEVQDDQQGLHFPAMGSQSKEVWAFDDPYPDGESDFFWHGGG